MSNVEGSPIDMHAGEAVRVVYELKRRANGDSASGAGLVSAIFRWTPAGSDVEHRTVASLTGDALAYAKDRPSPSDPSPGLPSPHGCELLLAAGFEGVQAWDERAWSMPASANATKMAS